MTTPSISDLSALREVAEKATSGPWDVWREPCADKYEAANELSEQAHLTDGFAGAVFLLNANGKCPASTGCGPTSEANAAYIAAFNPQTVLALLDHLAAEKARADAAEAEREDIRAQLIRMVDIAEERLFTIASITEQLAEAREALRLAEGRLSLLLREYPEDSDTCDHPTATRYVLRKVSEALEPFAKLVTPLKPVGNAGAYSIRFADIERARATLSRLEKQEGEK